MEALTKAAVYASLLLAIGAVAGRWFILPRATALGAGERSRLEGALARLLRRAAMVLVAALAARLLFHTAAAFGLPAVLDGSRLRVMAFDSRWGQAWRVQFLASGVLLAAALVVPFRARAAWAVAAVAALAATATMPLVGHAAGSVARSALHVAHVLGAGLWLGTLGVLVLVGGPAHDRGALLRAFSPVAMAGAAILVPTGLVVAWLYLGSVGALWSEPYGRALTMKIALVAAVAGCGYWNWQSVRHDRTGAEHGASPAGQAPLAGLEALLAVAIVIVTSVLTELAHP